MMSAPSWIGEPGMKMLATSSFETCASRRVPTSMYSLSPTSFCSTMSAPTRREAMAVTPFTSSSTAWLCAMRSAEEKSGPVPTCVRARRMSFWKTMKTRMSDQPSRFWRSTLMV